MRKGSGEQDEKQRGDEADGWKKMTKKGRKQRERSRVLVKQNNPKNNMQHPCLERRSKCQNAQLKNSLYTHTVIKICGHIHWTFKAAEEN